MGLETVIKDIMGAAQTEVNMINADADAAEDDIKRLRQQEISSANLEVKRTMLNARKEVLDKVYDNAIETIASLPETKQEELLKAIIDENDSNGSKIYSNKDSEKLVKKLSSLEYTGNIDCIGGLIMENDDGTVRLDYTYDIIMKNVNEQSLKQTSDILFG